VSDEGFREIQLNGKQLIFLFMAVTVVLVVTFLFGVLVGRGVREGGGAPEIASSDIASDPGLVPASGQAGPTSAAGGAASPAPAAPPAEELSYARSSPSRFGSGRDAETGTACSRTSHPGAGVPEGAGAASAAGGPQRARAVTRPCCRAAQRTDTHNCHSRVTNQPTAIGARARRCGKGVRSIRPGLCSPSGRVPGSSGC
jgi:hypothetical protein